MAEIVNLDQQKSVNEMRNAINNVDLAQDSNKVLNTLLGLPDDQFAIVAPSFLADFERQYNLPENKIALVQMLNASGIKLEDLSPEQFAIIEQVETSDISMMKKRFITQMISIMYNAVSSTMGISKRIVRVPFERVNEDAKMPTYAHLTDAGADIYANEDITIAAGETVLIPTGIKVAVPQGYELQVRPKSGISLKTKLRIANAPGTIDAGYRDEIGIIVDNITPVITSAELGEDGKLFNVVFGGSYTISKGEKIAQLVLSESVKMDFYESAVNEIPNDGRTGGFGSTGNV